MSARRFPTAFYHGVRHFAAGEYFEAHEAFEECLDDVESDERWDLLVALVQVAVGYHKLSAGHPGGERMLGLGAEKLAAFPDVAWGVRVGALRARAEADRATPATAFTPEPPRIELVRT